jgi:hypothetical protein
VQILPRFRGRRPSLRSLTGCARESASLYRCWKSGVLDGATYMRGIRGLAVHATILTSIEQERMREHMANLEQQAQQLLEQRGRNPFGYGSDYASDDPVPASAESAP